MIRIKLSYFDLLTPDPVYVSGIGKIKPIKLKELSEVSYQTYQMYISLLFFDIKQYFDSQDQSSAFVEQRDFYYSLSEEDKTKYTVFDFFITNPSYNLFIQKCLAFFISGDVSFHQKSLSYLVQENETIVGTISRDNWSDVCDLILQRQYRSKSNELEDASKAKNKRALKILNKLKKGAQTAKGNDENRDYEIPNLISALASKSYNLNISNIWEITVFQLYDQFQRQQLNSVYDIQSTSASVWGTKENKFDINQWFKSLN